MAKILVIDDEEGMRYVLTNILKKAEYDVIAAEDGKQALELLASHRPDMAFLDIHLPDMDGTEVLKEIKKVKDIPVVMCSGFGNVDFAVATMKDGAFDYISKPFKNVDVLDMAKKALASVKTDTEKKQESEAGKPAEVAAAKSKRSRKTLWLPAAGILIVIGILAISAFLLTKPGKEKQEQQNIYTLTYNNPTGITFDGEYLWVSDWFGQTIYKHVIDDELSILKYFSFADLHPSGIAWGGDCIWTVDSWTSDITCHHLDDRLSIKKTYPYPGSEPTAIYFDGSFLWICDAEDDKIYKLKPEGDRMEIIAECQSPGPKPVGLFWDRRNIWTVDGDLKKVYKHNMDPYLTVVGTFKFPTGTVSGIKITGVSWDGENIWLSGDKKPEILRFNIKELIKLDI